MVAGNRAAMQRRGTEDMDAKEEIPERLRIPLGEVVRAWREFRGWSPTELAHRAGLTKGHLSEIEHNRIRRPRDEQLAKLAGALGISFWDLHAHRLPGESTSLSITDPLPAPAASPAQREAEKPLHLPQADLPTGSIGRRFSPISREFWDDLDRQQRSEDVGPAWREIQALIESVSTNPAVSAEAQRVLVGFFKAGLQWLEKQESR